jgi:hypothetical protein
MSNIGQGISCQISVIKQSANEALAVKYLLSIKRSANEALAVKYLLSIELSVNKA